VQKRAQNKSCNFAKENVKKGLTSGRGYAIINNVRRTRDTSERRWNGDCPPRIAKGHGAVSIDEISSGNPLTKD